MTLRRLLLEFKDDRILTRVLYRCKDGPGPSAKARRREVEQLAREGLERALEAIKEGPVECIGTAGFEVREDTLSAGPSYLSSICHNSRDKKGA